MFVYEKDALGFLTKHYGNNLNIVTQQFKILVFTRIELESVINDNGKGIIQFDMKSSKSIMGYIALK